MKKRNEYADNPWGFARFVFQKAFWQAWILLVTIILWIFMWSNYSCDSGGPRIEKTDVKVKIGESQ